MSAFAHLDPGALDLDAPPNHPSTVYDLIANVTHESTAGTTRDKENTVYKVHLRAGGTDDDWYQIQDLIVEKTRKEMIFLGETVLQVGRAVFFARCSFTHDSRRSGNEEACLRKRRWRLIGSRLRSVEQATVSYMRKSPHGIKSAYSLLVSTP
jgi:hypothetical protein